MLNLFKLSGSSLKNIKVVSVCCSFFNGTDYETWQNTKVFFSVLVKVAAPLSKVTKTLNFEIIAKYMDERETCYYKCITRQFLTLSEYILIARKFQ